MPFHATNRFLLRTFVGLALVTSVFSAAYGSAHAAVRADASRARTTLDTTPPDTTIATHPSLVSSTTSATFTFTSELRATFGCSLDGAAYTSCTSPKSYSGLANHAIHTFRVRATDSAGNVDPTPASYSWIVWAAGDTTPPDTTITSHPAAVTNATSASFGFSSEAGATFACSLDAGAYAACTSPKAYSGLANGSHIFLVRATDAAHNTDASPASFTWTVDTVAPDTTITSHPAASTNSTSASFGFSSEAGATFACALDAGAYAACTSPKAYTGLANGSHTFLVRATDAAGNTDASPASFAWTVDAVAPDTTITSHPAALTNVTDASFGFSSEAGATFACALDAGAYAACTSPKAYTGLANGSHTFLVRATDAAGNTDASPASFTWTVDTVAPDTTITSHPAASTNATDASFGFSSEAGASFACSLDAGAYAACSSPKAYSGLASGSHTFSVRATDAAGNTDASPASFTWTVDAVAPDTTITSHPAALTNSTSASFGFSSEAGATFACALDAGAYAACSSPKAYTALADGNHTFSVRATDGAGNTDASPASFSWTVDTAAPDTTITSHPAAPTNATGASFAFSSEAGASFACSLDGAAYSACSSPNAYTGLADGSHTFSVRATDAAGNTDGSPASFSWLVDTIAPTSSIRCNGGGCTGVFTTNVDVTLSATDAGSGIAKILYTLDGSDPSPVHGAVYLGDFALTATTTVRFRAYDAAGNEEAIASSTITIDTTPPETTITSNPLALTNATDANFAFTSEAGASFACALDAGAYTACSSPAGYTGLSDGSHTFSVRATDTAGNTDPSPASFTWTVDTVAPDSNFDATPATLTNATGATFAFSSEAGATFTCSLDGGTYAGCSSPHTISGLADGSHTFAVFATDTAGNTDASPETFTWEIDTVAPDTTIDKHPSSPTNDTAASFLFSSEAGATFACSLDGGAYTDCASPQAYTGLADGDHTFSVRATDGAGNTGAPVASTLDGRHRRARDQPRRAPAHADQLEERRLRILVRVRCDPRVLAGRRRLHAVHVTQRLPGSVRR